MRRLGGIAAVLLVMGAIGLVAILLAVYGVGCFQLRRPSLESSGAVAPHKPASTDREFGSSLETPPRDRERESNGIRPPELQAAAVIRIGGVVIDFSPNEKQSGVVASGVEVQLGKGLSVRTGDDGRFTFVIPDPGRRPVDFTVNAEGSPHLRPRSASVVLTQGKRDALDLVLRRVPIGDLAGVTVDLQGRPVPGVHLTVRYSQAFRETDSDEQGRFRIPDAEWLGQLEANKEGYALLCAVKPSQLEDGGWEPLRVVLASTAKLVVRAVDGHGDGIEGVRVAASVSEWESNGPKRFDNVRTFRSAPGAVTRPDGRATIDGVWADQRLSLEVDAGDTEDGRLPRTFERELDGRLLRAPSKSGRPILLSAGEPRELTAVFDESPLISGVVLDESSQPVSGAYVRLEGYQGDRPSERLQVFSKCDTNGRFSFETPFPLPTSPRVTATDRWPFGATGKAMRVASLPLALADPPRSDLVLLLHSARRIAGRVSAPDGTGVGALVSAFLAHEARDSHGWGPTALTENDGSFVMEHVEPGRYELLAQPHTNEPYGEVRAADVDAGREDVQMIVPARRAAHVTFEVEVPGGEAKLVVLLNARPRCPPSAMSGVPSLPFEAEYQEPGNWPSGVVGQAHGAGGFEDERGPWIYNLVLATPSPETLDLDVGEHWLGVRGTDGEGRPLFPVGTGLVRIEAGEYRLRFKLAPAVRIEGRLVGSDVLDLEVGIARRGGKLFEVDAGYGTLRPTRPVGADGAFSFWAVPVGDNEIWIGTADELAASKPSRRLPLTVDAKGVPFLDIPVR